jgi:hypothetical protein
MATMARSGHATVTGEVRSIQRRTEWVGEGSRSIWTFRLEGTDQHGSRLGPVEVEMRGFSFEGSLSEGDSVRVEGRWRRGALRADQVQNLTTGVLVRAKTYKGLRIAAVAFIVLVASGIAFFSITSAREADERREQLQERQRQLQGEVPEGFCEEAESAGLEPPMCE